MIAYTQKLQILTGLGDYKRANEFVDDIIMKFGKLQMLPSKK